MDFLRKISGFTLILLAITSSGFSQSQKDFETAFSTSFKFESEGDYTKAADAIKKLFPSDSYEFNLRLGWLSFKAGLLDESESYYRRAIQLMPFGIEARFGIINPLSSLGKWNQVITIYQEILKIDPQNSVANFRFGLVYYGQAEYAKAEPLFTKVVNLYPFDYDGLQMLGWTKLRLGKTQDAKALFNKALLNRPGDASCLEGLSLIK